VDALPDLSTLSDAELKELIDNLTREEDEISRRRRILQGQIDILRAGGQPDVERLAEILSGKGGSAEGTPAGSDKDLDELVRKEDEISQHRRILHGKIDILRAELTFRLKQKGEGELLKEVDVDRLAEILSGKAAPPAE